MYSIRHNDLPILTTVHNADLMHLIDKQSKGQRMEEKGKSPGRRDTRLETTVYGYRFIKYH